MRRKWVKMWVNKVFEFYREVQDANARAIFWGLLALAGDNSIPGHICFTENIGFTIEQLCEKLYTSDTDIKSAFAVLEGARVIKILDKNIIKVLHWEKYQSEYDRQKPYRNKQKQAKVTSKVTG